LKLRVWRSRMLSTLIYFVRGNEMGSSYLRRTTTFYVVAFLLALPSAFSFFYTVRLLYVTRGLTAIRAGGKGAYVGAVVFPLLALLLGWCAWRCIRAAGRA
jgi:hypothetical protein